MSHFIRTATVSVAALALSAGAAFAQAEHTLRIQSHYAPETPSGKLAQQFFDDVETMSGGRIDIEPFFSSSVVKSVETFDAAASGILDCDMTGGSYITGKNAAFQFVGDVMGGYDTPWQNYAWVYHGGGQEAAEELYHPFDMHPIGWWIYGQESLASTTPLPGIDALNNWKFRSPPGLETDIFAALGASPVVMDFTEIFTALETRIIDAADASGLANNVGLGLYDIAKHTTYPGFHSMPMDHVACRMDAWEAMPEDLQRIMEVAMQKLAFQTALTFEVMNNEAAAALPEQGVTLHDWSDEDRKAFRKAAQDQWQVWAEKSPEARSLVDSHVKFMTNLGLIAE